MDDADRAQALIDAELDATLGARRRGATYRLHCADCGLLLEQHRREYGLCMECASDRERDARLRVAK